MNVERDRKYRGAVAMLAIALSACQTTSDPREGGFFGGVHGISTGAYEQRIQEQEERLERLRQLQGDLDTERTALESRQQEQQSAYEREKARLTALATETRSLEAKLQTLHGTEKQQEGKRQDLLRRLGALQKKIDQTAGDATDHSQVDVLVGERDALEEEYRLLLDIYREISQ